MKRYLLLLIFSILALAGCEKEGGSNGLQEVSIAEFLNASESEDIWYKLTGVIESIKDDEYGDLTISDESGSVYIYGLTKEKVSVNDRSFSELGLNVGDVVTLATRRSSYNGQPQGGGNTYPAYYISHLDLGPEVNNNGFKYVDLGLSALWATKNVGAESPVDIGWRCAFKELMPKSDYTQNNYNPSSSDVAQYHWSGDWRLPNESECEELVNDCEWRIQTVDGVEVAAVTGPNGNTIYLPFMSYIQGEGYQGWYWSSTSYSSSKGICIHFDRNTMSWGSNDKYYGFLARPVMTNPNYSSGNDTGNSGGNSGDGSGGSSSGYEKPDIGFYDFTAYKTSIKVQYKIYNKDEAKVTSAKVYYGTSSNPTSSKSATVSGVLITANLTGLKAGTEYYVKCVATGKGGTTTTSVTKVITNY